jgi:transcriptional regulator with XRE-family HTH domain
MITIDMLGKVRRMKMRDKLTISEISKRTGLARNTVKRWLKAPGDVSPRYLRRSDATKLSAYEATLVMALKADAHRHKDGRRTARALFVQIRAQGYRGGYSAVTDFIRAWRSNVVQDRKFSDLLADVIRRYQNRSIETAQVMEELIAMAKKFREAANRGDQLGLREDEVKFYDALANNESAVRELQDETLKKIAQELTQSLRDNLTVDWSERESVRAKLRLMVKRILKKYKYPPDQADVAVELVLAQAQALGEDWTL